MVLGHMWVGTHSPRDLPSLSGEGQAAVATPPRHRGRGLCGLQRRLLQALDRQHGRMRSKEAQKCDSKADGRKASGRQPVLGTTEAPRPSPLREPLEHPLWGSIACMNAFEHKFLAPADPATT